jgi:hypothetical protein
VTYYEIERRDGEYVVYEWGQYEEWSVLAGQERKRYIEAFDTIEKAKLSWPEAEEVQGNRRAENFTSHLPGEEWDDARQEYRL